MTLIQGRHWLKANKSKCDESCKVSIYKGT